jgi:catechol 2,3-dioxygenase
MNATLQTDQLDDGADATHESITYGAVHLDVVDRARSLAFWRDTIGLTELDRGDDHVSLGAGERELIVLHTGAVRPSQPGHTGLYHVALHLPTAAEFARTLSRLAAKRVPQSPTDHIFSKATYVHDPDGIMLELTLETPDRYQSIEIQGDLVVLIDSDGRRRAGTEPLDLRDALAALDGPLETPLAAGTIVGHVHLHVADLAGAYRYYRDEIGFTGHALMTPIGMADLSAGGRFPHRIALNNWNGPTASPPPPGTAGLHHIELHVNDQATLTTTQQGLTRAGHTVTPAEGAVETHDPAGNTLQISARPV